MKSFKSNICGDIDVKINDNGGAIKTIEIKQEDDCVVIAEKSTALNLVDYLLKISEQLEG